ncbi:MAG: glycyl radical protein [Bacteroidales bacterium]|jgi:pyruvate formate-lyase/glycerol dehydratase family glycyl radical enzyme|nr:glycyl radical protein [Bacteroidales bacterium]
MLTKRIQQLRTNSLNAEYKLSAERALLMTEFYRNDKVYDYSVPVQRALSFEYLFRHKHLCVLEGELIIGERGPAPKASPTYPEITLHSIEDLLILNSREKVSFTVDEETRKSFEEVIIPFWIGKTNRDRVFNTMTDEWHAAYEAGVFTEFQEQRAPGHTVLGKKIYTRGLLFFIAEIEAHLDELNELTDEESRSKREELKAMRITAQAMIMYAERNADYLMTLAENEQDTERKRELLQIADVCRKVPANAPETLQEALQYYWFVHLGVICELNPWDSFNPGRLDQHLYPFYKNDIAEGRHTEESAQELLQAFWVKFNNHPSPPKIGVTAEESSTYTDFCLINLGGLKEDGSDAVNELSFVLLDVIEEMRLLQPSSMIQVSKLNPDAFIDRAVKITKTGFGQPSIFNTEAIIQELLNQGKDIVDARNGGASGCVETGAFGTEAYILTGYFNLVKVLELTLNNGIDPRSRKRIGLETGDPAEFNDFALLQAAFVKQLNHFIDIKVHGNVEIEKIFAENLPVPFLSLFVDDCITNGMDYNVGGARYNTSYIQGVGLGSITDIFTALKFHVYESKSITIPTLLKVLEDDFSGSEEIRAELIYNTPKYGNDDDRADAHAVWVFEQFYAAVNGRPNYRGGKTRINMLPTTSHVYFGSVVGATADGRHAGEPLSEGISPFQGMDTKGPTAVIKSAAKFDHLRTGGTLLNQKFTPDFFKDENAIRKVTQLVRSYFRMMGHHIQFNVVSADTLRDAQKFPEKYQDLIVRVAGYSDYFNDLGEALQNEIIRRTEQDI